MSSLNNYERGRLSDALSEKVVKAGEIVVNEGDDGDDFYLIQAGEFAVTKKGVEGEVSIRLTKGMYFGEVAECHRSCVLRWHSATKFGFRFWPGRR